MLSSIAKLNKEINMSENKPTTCVAFVLDQSGSMSSTKTDAINGYNEHVQQCRQYAKEQNILVSLVTFNSDVYEHMWLQSVDNLQEASADNYHPDGTTAFRDALGYTIQKLSQTAPKGEDVSFLVIVFSDGAENASKHISPSILKELVDTRQKQKNWTFSYVGCGEKIVQQVHQETGIPISNMALWDNKTSKSTKRGMKRCAEKMNKYFACRSVGVQAMYNYHSDVGAVADYTQDEATSISTGDLGNPSSIITTPGNITLTGVIPTVPTHIEESKMPTSKVFCSTTSVTWE